MEDLRGLTTNEYIRDEVIRHQVEIEAHKKSAVAEFLEELDRAALQFTISRATSGLERIRSRGHQVLRQHGFAETMGAIDERISGAFGKLRSRLTAHLVDLAKLEGRWNALLLERATPVNLVFNVPGVNILRSVVTTRPMNGRFLRDWIADLDANTRARLRREMTLGLTNGETTAQIVRRLRGTSAARYTDGVLQTSRRHTETIVRTATQHTVNQARQAVLEENAQFIDVVQWVSTLDGRTSIICASLDGQTWPVNAGPRPPAHPGCRSAVVPVVKGWEELGLKAPPPGVRASMNGTVPADQHYGEWLKRQKPDFQERALGAGKAELFRRGVVPIERFTDEKLKPLKIVDLERIEQEILSRAKRSSLN